MTEYQNGFFDKTLFEEISKDLLISFKQNLARVYERKYEFMRDPESLMGKDEQPILEGIYEPEPTKDTRKVLDLGKSAKVGASQQAASYDSAE